MKKVLMSLLLGAFLLTGISFAQTPPSTEAPAAPEAASSATVKQPVRHPEVHRAIRRLKSAKQDLEKVTHSYSGHKAKAMEAIDKALEELRAIVGPDKN